MSIIFMSLHFEFLGLTTRKTVNNSIKEDLDLLFSHGSDFLIKVKEQIDGKNNNKRRFEERDY